MRNNQIYIKFICALTLLALLHVQTVSSASYGKPYQASPSLEKYNSASTSSRDLLPSEQTQAELTSALSTTELFTLSEADEDPFDPGAGTDDPNAYNDVSLGSGKNVAFFLVFCSAIYGWYRSKHRYKSVIANHIKKPKIKNNRL